MDWRTAFLRQSWSDFQVAKMLSSDATIPLCQELHFLQMTLEKLAKGYQAPAGAESPPRLSHKGVSQFIRSLKFQNRIHEPFHRLLGMSTPQRRSYFNGILPTIEYIENLAPALANPGALVNCEYPWLGTDPSTQERTIYCPRDYAFPKALYTKLAKVSRLIDLIFQSCDEDLE